MEVVVVFNTTSDVRFDADALIYGPPLPTIASGARNNMAPTLVAPVFGVASAENVVSSYASLSGITQSPQAAQVPVGKVFFRQPKSLSLSPPPLVAAESSTRTPSVDHLSSLLKPPPHINQETLSIILICSGIVAGVLFICCLLFCRLCAKRRERHRVRKRLRLEGFLPSKNGSGGGSGQFATTHMPPAGSGDDNAYNASKNYILSNENNQSQPIRVTSDMLEPLPMSFPQGAFAIVPTSHVNENNHDVDSSQFATIAPTQAARYSNNMPSGLVFTPVASAASSIPSNYFNRQQRLPEFYISPAPNTTNTANNNNQDEAGAAYYSSFHQRPIESDNYGQRQPPPPPVGSVSGQTGGQNDAESARTTAIQVHHNRTASPPNMGFSTRTDEIRHYGTSKLTTSVSREFLLDDENLFPYKPAARKSRNGSPRRPRRSHSHHHHHRSRSHEGKERRRRRNSTNNESVDGAAVSDQECGAVALVQSRTHPEFSFQVPAITIDNNTGRSKQKDGGNGGSNSTRHGRLRSPDASNSEVYRNLHYGTGSTLREVKQARMILRQAEMPYNFRISKHTAV